jgi:hypothetical protein
LLDWSRSWQLVWRLFWQLDAMASLLVSLPWHPNVIPPYSISPEVRWINSGVLVAMTAMILFRTCLRSRSFSPYSMFFMYPCKIKSIGVRSGFLGGHTECWSAPPNPSLAHKLYRLVNR